MSTELPGWHGKLPTLGDFASRRLPHEFVEAWDAWLAAGLAALRQAEPQAWLDGYLASPIWRFLLMPGALGGPCGEHGWAGVLMPSVDRAGRYFPFTIATELAAPPRGADDFAALQRWLHEVDDVAADALQDDWTIQQLEAELARVRKRPGPASASSATLVLAPGVDTLTVPIASAAEVTSLTAGDAATIWQTAVFGQAFWWCEPDADPGRLVVSRGLPSGAAIGALLGAVPIPQAGIAELLQCGETGAV